MCEVKGFNPGAAINVIGGQPAGFNVHRVSLARYEGHSP